MSITNKSLDAEAELGQLGNVRLRNYETNEIVLVPTPSRDPRDPLNRSKGYRFYLATVVCIAVFLSNFLAAGPSVAIVDITIDYLGPPLDPHDMHDKIAKISYLFTTTALLQGLGNLIWVPIAVKYGRRPVYIVSFTLYLASAAWAGGAKTFASALAARAVMGFACGSAETLAPMTISDSFSFMNVGELFSSALSCGIGVGIIVAGLITKDLQWRYIYWVAVALIGAITLVIIFTFPETAFDRASAKPAALEISAVSAELDPAKPASSFHDYPKQPEPQQSADADAVQRGFAWESTFRMRKQTDESILKIFIRPVLLLGLPLVLWSTLVLAVTIGFLVAITSNFASAFGTLYHFQPWQSGLCFVGSVIGSLIAIYFGGHLSDGIADYFTKENGGVRKPEMRLPAMMVSVVTAPLALILYGVGIGSELHWMVPTLGLGLLNFSLVQATNVSLVYAIDSYRPVAGEITVTQFAFKSAFGFLLSFYTNPWIEEEGYIQSFGTMAGISGLILLGWIPMYYFGESLRNWSWNWPLINRYVHWGKDRDVGE